MYLYGVQFFKWGLTIHVDTMNKGCPVLIEGLCGLLKQPNIYRGGMSLDACRNQYPRPHFRMIRKPLVGYASFLLWPLLSCPCRVPFTCSIICGPLWGDVMDLRLQLRRGGMDLVPACTRVEFSSLVSCAASYPGSE